MKVTTLLSALPSEETSMPHTQRLLGSGQDYEKSCSSRAWERQA